MAFVTKEHRKMQWQTKIPLIAILRGVTPEEALATLAQ